MGRVLAVFLSLLLVCNGFGTPSYAKVKQASAIRTCPNPVLCVTIDDGNNRAAVTSMLKTLREAGVHCTFFVIGSRLLPLADLWRQAVRDGHEISYHSMKHTALGSRSASFILCDLNRWNSTCQQALGADYKIPKLARLPGGSGNNSARVLKVFRDRGYQVVGWNSDILTGVLRSHPSNPTSRILDYIHRTAKPNGIILLHFNPADAAALPKMLQWLKPRFRLGTVSQGLGAPAAAPSTEPPAIPSTEPATTASATPTNTPVNTPENTPSNPEATVLPSTEQSATPSVEIATAEP